MADHVIDAWCIGLPIPEAMHDVGDAEVVDADRTWQWKRSDQALHTLL